MCSGHGGRDSVSGSVCSRWLSLSLTHWLPSLGVAIGHSPQYRLAFIRGIHSYDTDMLSQEHPINASPFAIYWRRMMHDLLSTLALHVVLNSNLLFSWPLIQATS